MRKVFILLCFVFFFAAAKAEDVTATVIPAVIGVNNGAISLTISAGIAPFTFNWTGPDGFVATEQDISSLAPGLYCVTVYDAACGQAFLCVTVEETMANAVTSMDKVPMVIQVGPNPFEHEIAIAATTDIPGAYVIELQDIAGKVIVTQSVVLNTGENNLTLNNIPNLAAGTYQVVVIAPTGVQWANAVIHL